MRAGKGHLSQWRLMVYLEDIKEIPSDFKEIGKSRKSTVNIRYALAKGIEEKWRVAVESSCIPIRKVKIHYFFSEEAEIEAFLKNTEIVLSVLSG